MIRTWRSHLGLFCKLTVLLPFLAVCNSLYLTVNAQILPDSTLGHESSVVTPIDPTIERIDGGGSRGANLFHSFREFNIQEGNAAYFANPAGIKTIFSRVTGNNPSRLFGTLGVLGNANLFFINPNGIIFGPNARLDITGSFIGSTANSIIFPDGSRFSATNPNAAPLLTIDVPIPLGLEFEGGEPGSIINSGNLEAGQHLALVGGTVVSTGSIVVPKGVSLVTVGEGIITTVQFNNEGTYLGKVTRPLTESFQTVSSESKLIQLVFEGGEATGLTITPTGQVSVAGTDTVVATGDIVTVGGVRAQDFFGGGTVVIDSHKNIKLSGKVDASSFDIFEFLDVPEGTYLGDGGDITLIAQGDIIATSSILAKGILGGDISFSSGGTVSLNDGLEVNVRSGGEGNITINARNVEMLEASKLRAGIDVGLGSPDAGGGDVVIKATESITLDGGSFIANAIIKNAIGNTGDINITTSSLSLSNDSEISISNSEGSQGNVGNVNITADTLSVQNHSRLFALTVAIGNAGDININASKTVLFDSSESYTDVRETAIGNGGDINITTETLTLQNGSQLLAGMRGMGNAGNININASNTVTLDGFRNTVDEQGNPQTYYSGAVSRVEQGAKGLGGNVTIATNLLVLSNGAFLDASTFGQGDAGNITIEAGKVNLDGGGIFTQAASRTGGNITLDLQNLLTLRKGSQISTTAGTAQAGGDGGNINIATRFIVTSPFENSDITANAFLGSGGNINITTQGIFGLEVRNTLTPLSDITASSAFGLDGNISIDNLGIDPTRGIESLPQEVVNPQVFRGCEVRDGEAISEFYRLGRGGIPSSPDDWLNEAPFGNEGLIPLEIPLDKIPLQINWKDIPTDGVFLSCRPLVSQK